MASLIDKSALVAEIESKIEKYTKRGEESDAKRDGYGMYWGGVLSCLNEVRTLCDTLEVKEVDLEDSIKETLAQKYIDYTFKRHNIDLESKEGQLIYYAYIHGMNQCLKQLKARKGE